MRLNSYTHNLGELPEVSITLDDVDMNTFGIRTFYGDTIRGPIGTALSIIPVDSTRPEGETKVVSHFPSVEKVYFNKSNNTTCVIWSDGVKTILSLCEGDNWDEEKVLALAYMKRACGNNGSFKKVFEKFNIY